MPSFFHSHVSLLLLLSLLLVSPLAANAHQCSQEFRQEVERRTNSTRIIQHCRKKSLAAEFAWSLDKTSRRLYVAFGAKLRHETGWVAWGVNPRKAQMVGTRALIGIKQRNGSLGCHKYNVSGATKFESCPLVPSNDSALALFAEYRLEYFEGIEYYVIVATVVLSEEFNSSRVNVVWQIGEGIDGNQPLMHPKSLNNFDSTETVDLETGAAVSYTSHQRRNMRIGHGVVNIVGWGSLIPSGVIVARYTRIHPQPCKRWYDVHVSIQSSGYIIGSSGWALGLWLGSTSPNYKLNLHSSVGFIIFVLASVQMLAWRLRPAPDDAYRTYWNMYHHFLGYAILVLISFNIFLGINILEPESDQHHHHVWKWAYIGLLVALGMLALSFEVLAWIKFIILKP